MSTDMEMSSALSSLSITVTKPRDPMTALPLETVRLILRQLSYRQHIQLLQISKSWSEIVLDSNLLKETLTFPTRFNLGMKSKRDLLTPIMMKAAIRRWTRPKHLIVNDLTNDVEEVVTNRLVSWQGLSSLERLEVGSHYRYLPVTNLPFDHYKLKVLMFDQEIEVPLVWICDSLLPKCPYLESARISRTIWTAADDNLTLKSESLRALNLMSCRQEIGRSSGHLFSGLPNLRELRLCGYSFPDWVTVLDFRHMKHLSKLTLASSRVMPNLLLPTSVSSLYVDNVGFQHLQVTLAMIYVYPALDNLKSLTLILGNDVYPDFIMQAASNMNAPSLTYCSITSDSKREPDVTDLLDTDFFRAVTTFHLSGSIIDDDDAEAIVYSLPRLRRLILENSDEITDEFVKSLINAPTSTIKGIDVMGCEQVSEEMVIWAREYGVELSWDHYYGKCCALSLRVGRENLAFTLPGPPYTT